MNHQTVSFVKSAIRLAGFIILPVDVAIGAVVLAAAEILGIIEELV